MRVHFKTVYLPHLNYTVRFRKFKKPPSSISGASAWIQPYTDHSCTIYSPEYSTPSGMAHELVHVLQYICADYYMIFEKEKEHMAYIMQYLMGEAFDYDWVKPRKRKPKSRRKP